MADPFKSSASAESDAAEAVIGGSVVPTPDQNASSTAPSESTGGSSPEPSESVDTPPEAPVALPDVSVKLNPDQNLDSPSYVQVPSFPEVQLSDSPTPVPHDHAVLLLTTNVVVAAD